MAGSAYRGRFAPSPTGPLHAGSMVAALASWLDARAAGGAWLVRIEDADLPRCPPGTDALVLSQLAQCGLHPDEPPCWQSRRDAAYAAALQRLLAQRQAYACGCTRREIEGALAAQGRAPARDQERVYPGTCRDGLHGKPARAVRYRVSCAGAPVLWTDRRLGLQQQDVAAAVGDFVLRRADGLWAYQLAVVVDDAAHGITHVVRGEDLADNTPRQQLLLQALQQHIPRYFHTPLVWAADGHKLSKQNGAAALDLRDPQATLRALGQAALVLGLAVPAAPTVPEWLAQAVAAWGHRWPAAAEAGQ